MELNKINKIVIAGAGVMGASIAQIFAENNYTVVLYDIAEQFLQKGRDLIRINQEILIKEGAVTKEQSEKLIGLISYSLDKECFKDADYVIEAIVEKMEVKHEFWNIVSSIVSEDAILTSNTSGLSLTEIAKAVKIPERFSGMHWVNPPHLVPLVEVIKGEKTSHKAAEVVFKLAEKLGKKPVIVKDAPGFVLNRFQFAVLREAMHIVESGIASMEDVDKVFKYGLGMRYACLGPFEIADLGGLDTFYNIASYLFKDISGAKEVHHLLADLMPEKAYGVKSCKGFYDYPNGRDKEVIEKRDADFIKIAKCLYK
ncbi:3-hydroxyacyl-CoA dehydrogenase family protein [Clostridium bovifaecis]|uniref:3-hydroxybutyryl-CoA dehydrogenase n=1 Tax=Clostridium bovifaecis TaxID=2184719 RepID=A0A6I6ESW8_9CLOT|nr:3-hydroxyacyl-CoA dehydrogenase family protein [Clostridium bovifaecis]